MVLLFDLSVSAERECVAALPARVNAGAQLGGSTVTLLAESTALLASGGKTVHLTMLVDGVADPVEAGITTNSLVEGIHADDFEVLVGSILVDPVSIEDSQGRNSTSDTFLSEGTDGTFWLQLKDTLVDGLAGSVSTGHLLLAATTANSNAVDKHSLLGLVA